MIYYYSDLTQHKTKGKGKRMSQLNMNGIGTLTADPTLKTVGENKAQVCNFTLAFNRSWKDKNDEWKQDTTFMKCELWGNRASQVSEMAKKGDELTVVGSLVQQSWTTEKDEKRTTYSFRVVDVRLCRKFNKKSESNENAPQTASANAPANDNDIPF